MTRLTGQVEKGWGSEEIWATNDKYCGKLMHFNHTWHNPPLLPHQLVCYATGTIIEVSTPDSVEDNYRVGKGDSQK